MPKDEEFYFEQIEATFQAGTPRLLSPGDWALIASWFKARVPLTAALVGIKRSFERFRPRYIGDRIRTLYYCAPEVMKAASEIGPLPDPAEARAVQEEAGKKLAALEAGADWKTL